MTTKMDERRIMRGTVHIILADGLREEGGGGGGGGWERYISKGEWEEEEWNERERERRSIVRFVFVVK
jgi:hypothetical protein